MCFLYPISTTLVVVVFGIVSNNRCLCCCLGFKHHIESRAPPVASLYSKSTENQSNDRHISPFLVNEFVSVAHELANAAGDAILPFWRQKDVEIEYKKDIGRSVSQTNSPVTIADRSAETAMRELIENKFPSHGIYGEEFGEVRVDADFVWVLDPIDGTKAFVTGKPTWGILISLLFRGVPVVGVIDNCVLKERWVGSIGNPTLLNGEPVSVAKATAKKLCDATIYTTTPDMFRVGEELKKFEIVRDASLCTLYGCDCYAYALVASGFGADAVIEADLGLYDYAAIVPIIQGAGGIITDWNGNLLTLQNHHNSKGRVVACSNAALHSEMLYTLSTVETEEEDHL